MRNGSKPLQMGRKSQGGTGKRFVNPRPKFLYSVVFNLCSLLLEIALQGTAYILTKKSLPLTAAKLWDLPLGRSTAHWATGGILCHEMYGNWEDWSVLITAHFAIEIP